MICLCIDRNDRLASNELMEFVLAKEEGRRYSEEVGLRRVDSSPTSVYVLL